MDYTYYKEKLKDITAFVKILPYLYVFAYFVGMGCYLVGSEILSFVVDQLLYVAPLVVLVNLVLSRFCELCSWHRTACLILLFPTLIVFVDNFVYMLSDYGTKVNIISIAIIAVVTIVSAYHVFLRPKTS